MSESYMPKYATAC
uniref:Uncharacterized protein n=1 Tax=Anguilla anguilla TaxID=7936 RepID=A0A0E9PUW1_ANGAN